MDLTGVDAYMTVIGSSSTSISSTPTTSRIHWLIVAGLMLLGFALRSYIAFSDPYYGFDVRQFHSAVVMKGYYYDTESFAEPVRRAAIINSERQPYLEPRIMEGLTTLGFQILGNDPLWLPSLISSFFWVVGALFVFLLGREVGSADAGLFAAAVYLFIPQGVLDSNNFQPDPLMVMLIVASAYTIYRYARSLSRSALIVAGLCSALAIFVKLQSAIFIAPIFFFLSVGRVGLRKTFLSVDSYLFAFVALLPALLFYFDGFFISRRMQGVEGGRFLPQLWFMPDYWRGWLRLINTSVSFVAVVAALLGIFATLQRLYRSMLVGLWVGYILYGLIFNYNIYTHLYYQLPLVPVVALSVASIGHVLMQHLRQVNTARWSQAVVYGILLLGVGFSVLLVLRDEEPEIDYEAKVAAAAAIGEEINHSVNTVFVAESYGLPLTYYGDFAGIPWPSLDERAAAALGDVEPKTVEEELVSNRHVPSPEFFIVTDFEEFELQPELKEYLDTRYPVFAQTSEYLIYDLHGLQQASTNTDTTNSN
jgi:hypothetical protein